MIALYLQSVVELQRRVGNTPLPESMAIAERSIQAMAMPFWHLAVSGLNPVGDSCHGTCMAACWLCDCRHIASKWQHVGRMLRCIRRVNRTLRMSALDRKRDTSMGFSPRFVPAVNLPLTRISLHSQLGRRTPIALGFSWGSPTQLRVRTATSGKQCDPIPEEA